MPAVEYISDTQTMHLDSNSYSPFQSHSNVKTTGRMPVQEVPVIAADFLTLADEKREFGSLRVIFSTLTQRRRFLFSRPAHRRKVYIMGQNPAATSWASWLLQIPYPQQYMGDVVCLVLSWQQSIQPRQAKNVRLPRPSSRSEQRVILPALDRMPPRSCFLQQLGEAGRGWTLGRLGGQVVTSWDQSDWPPLRI